jgi:23S rRNA (adenine-N6)-dimethyltransferase
VADRAQAARRRRRELSQNFLRSRRLADDIVRGLDVRADELVVEIGAGDGRLTAPLAERARRVVAIELDPRLAKGLRRRFEVVEGDALSVTLPDEPFRVVGNVPFHLTTAILRRLLGDLRSPLRRADLIVQWGLACKRAVVVPTTQLGAEWGPWWELAVVRRIDASAFERDLTSMLRSYGSCGARRSSCRRHSFMSTARSCGMRSRTGFARLSRRSH